MKRLAITLITLLIAACSMAESSPPITPATMQVFVENGGWCWFQDPRAIIVQDQLIVGAVSIRPKGVVKAGVYDLAAGKSLGTAVLNDDFQPDDHNAPAFHLRQDGRLLAVYAGHGSDEMHHYRISAPGDFLHWEPEQSVPHPGARVTYMNLYRLDAENRLYCFYRRTEPARHLFNPYFMTSNDDGSTWREGGLLIHDGVDGVQRPYVRYWGDGKTIHLLFTEAHPRDYNNGIYYAAFREGQFFRANGPRIKDLAKDGPLEPREADRIYEGGEGRVAWTSALVTDAQGHPHAVFSVRHHFKDHRFHRAYWDGTAWQTSEVAHAGIGLYEKEQDYTGLITLDPLDPWQIYLSSDVDPVSGAAVSSGLHEIYAARVEPGAALPGIPWLPLTQHSPVRNIRPVFVTGNGHKVLLWLRGPWRTYTDYDSDVVGVVIE